MADPTFTDDQDKKLRELAEADVREVSVVDAPANMRRFLLVKRREDVTVEGEKKKPEEEKADENKQEVPKDTLLRTLRSAVERLMSVMRWAQGQEKAEGEEAPEESAEKVTLTDKVLGALRAVATDLNRMLTRYGYPPAAKGEEDEAAAAASEGEKPKEADAEGEKPAEASAEGEKPAESEKPAEAEAEKATEKRISKALLAVLDDEDKIKLPEVEELQKRLDDIVKMIRGEKPESEELEKVTLPSKSEVEELVAGKLKDTLAKVIEKFEEVFKTEMEPVSERLSKLEAAGGGSQSLAGQESVEGKKDEKETDKGTLSITSKDSPFASVFEAVKGF